MKTLYSLLLIALPTLAQAASISVKDAYAFAPNPNAPTGGVFMEIQNHGDTPVTLLGVEGDIAKRIELHSNEMTDGVMKMEHLVDGLEIPANGCALLERGGFHVMLMGLNSKLEDGVEFPLTLKFSDGEDIKYNVSVDLGHEAKPANEQCVRAEAAQMMQEGEMSHETMGATKN